MPALNFPAPILFVSSDPSFFGQLKEDGKELTLVDVTRIDFPLIEKGLINKEHFEHALKSLEQKNLHLVISDEVFLHHIADYGPEAQKNIAESIKETVASVFAEEKDPLHIVTVDLAKTSKLQTVQISALTKQNLSFIQEAAAETGTTLLSIIPASFVVKAFVSVDPSLFVLQTEHSYLLTSHYIGVDFAKNISKDDEDALISTIKKLKKEREHIQHVYICSETKELVKLHEKLETVIPVQDVDAPSITTERDTPFFLSVISAGIKDVLENDFPMPIFASGETVDLEVSKKVDKPEAKAEKKIVTEEPEEDVDDEVEEKDEKEIAVEKKAAAMAVEIDETEDEEEEAEKEPKSKRAIEVDDLPTPVVLPKPAAAVTAVAAPTVVAAAPAVASTIKPPVIVSPTITPTVDIKPPTMVLPPKEVQKTVLVEPGITKPAVTETTKPTPTTVVTRSDKKNGGGFFKYLFLTLGVAIVISLVGGGIVISQQALSEKGNGQLQTPVAEATPTPTAEEVTPTPKPTAAQIDMSELTVSVVNATKIAGKAGKVATAAKKTEVKKVDSGNAKDTYEEGTYIMFAKDELSSTKEKFEEATGLTFEVKEMSEKENPDETYDVVIVLAE